MLPARCHDLPHDLRHDVWDDLHHDVRQAVHNDPRHDEDHPMTENAMTNRRLHIDWTACEGRGLCIELLPELLTADEWGYPLARDGSREPAVPAALVRPAEYAESSCPRLALKVLPIH